MLAWWMSLVLGVVEGLTEFLPVSSTAHLLLAQRAMGIESTEAANAYAVCIQAGAILAVVGLYFRRVKEMALGVIGRHGPGRVLALQVVVGFLPAAVIGFLFDKKIEHALFGLWPVVAAWFFGGVAILVLGRQLAAKPGARTLDQLTLREAMIIGFAQCLAMWPGTSRSLVTLCAGLLLGLEMAAAVEFSFLLGLITLGAAAAYKGLKHGGLMFETYGATSLAVGFLAAAVSAFLAVRWMVSWLQRHGLWVFGVYRILLALIVAEMLGTGMLRP